MKDKYSRIHTRLLLVSLNVCYVKSKFFKILIFSTGRLSISSQLLKLLFFTFYFTWTRFKTVSLFKCLTLSQPLFNRWTLFPKLSHQHLLLIPSFAIIFFKYSLYHTLTHTHMRTHKCVWIFLQVQYSCCCHISLSATLQSVSYLLSGFTLLLFFRIFFDFLTFIFLSFLLNFFF